MYAVEFETKVKNGIVYIPSQYEKIRESDNVNDLL